MQGVGEVVRGWAKYCLNKPGEEGVGGGEWVCLKTGLGHTCLMVSSGKPKGVCLTNDFNLQGGKVDFPASFRAGSGFWESWEGGADGA